MSVSQSITTSTHGINWLNFYHLFHDLHINKIPLTHTIHNFLETSTTTTRLAEIVPTVHTLEH